MKYQGYNGSIEVEQDKLIVVHSGMPARVGGLTTDQPRVIPLQAVSGVAFKDASRLTNGWLTLGLGGAPAPELGARASGSNADTVMFRHKDRDDFQALHDWLVTVIEHYRTHGIDPGAVEIEAANPTRSDRVQAKVEGLIEKSGQAGLPAAAWFPDPEDSMQWRYWDGARWTEHRAPRQGGSETATQVVTTSPTLTDAASTAAAAVTTAAGITARMLKRRLADRRSEPPTIEQIVAGCRQESPRHPLEEQVEVVGETYYVKGIKRVFADEGMPITPKGSTLEEMVCSLVPNPWNEHDPNAVAVCVGAHHVGYLPADLAIDYAPALIRLAQKELLGTGEARIWAKSDGGMVRARVTILIPEARAFQ